MRGKVPMIEVLLYCALNVMKKTVFSFIIILI